MAIGSYRATVVRTCSVTPRMRRVTVGGAGLEGFASSGSPTERVKLLLAGPGQERPDVPVVSERGFSYPPGARRPIMRTLTLRRFDPDALELDLDIVVHDGLASAWSVTARPGEEVGVLGPAGGFALAADGERYLLAGDETALPAIATILERLPGGASADVFVEVESSSAAVALPSAAGTRISWLHRNGSASGEELVAAVRAFDWPPAPVYVWAAGESLAMRDMRRHLREDLGLPRERYEITGHWRERLTEDEAAEAEFRAIAAARAAGASDEELADAGL